MNPGPRISKAPEVRREELIDAAEALFEEKGYDETSVSDIVHKVGVAQGTFYLYFRSKEMVLEALAERIADKLLEITSTTVDDPDLNAIEKLVLITRTTISLTAGRERTTNMIHEEKFAPLHQKLEKKVVPSLTELFIMIIEQGNHEGLFDVTYPREAAMALFGLSQQWGDSNYGRERQRSIQDDDLVRVLDVVERILGMKKGSFLERYKEMMI